MIKNILKIQERDNHFLVFGADGMLLRLDKNEYETLMKHGDDKRINRENYDFLSQLVGYGILEFDDLKKEDILRLGENFQKKYDLSLKEHNSPTPIYSAPVLAHLAVTNRCNMKCRYCSVRGLHNTLCNEELSTEEWKKIIDILADWGVFQIGFTGGEPTLREDLLELVKEVVKKGCVFNLTTNGWFLDEKLVSELAAAGMKQCQVSMDSHIAEVHDSLRGKGSYGRVIKAINLLQERGIAVGIDCVVSKNNFKNIMDFVKWISKNKIPYLTLLKLKKGDLSEEDFDRLSINYEDYSDLLRKVCLREKNENPNITLDCGSVSNLQGVAEKKSFSEIPAAGCPIGHHLICISPDGGIYMCAALLEKEFCLGNIMTDDIVQIWKENPLLKKLRMIKSEISGKCSDCERLDICRGGCRGIAFSLKKNLFSSDPTCGFNVESKSQLNEKGGKNGNNR